LGIKTIKGDEMRPSEKDYAPYYKGYIDKIKGDDIIDILQKQLTSISEFFKNVSEEKGNYAYADGKWSVKEVLGHMLDTERVFAYRALCIARKEKQSLPGMEQDDYVREGSFNKRRLKDLVNEFSLVRKANLALFNSFSERDLNNRGIASNNEVTVRALLFIIAGHAMHHITILREKYSV
jgi:uncharacterized damage-inducible protein DinB